MFSITTERIIFWAVKVNLEGQNHVIFPSDSRLDKIFNHGRGLHFPSVFRFYFESLKPKFHYADFPETSPWHMSWRSFEEVCDLSRESCQHGSCHGEVMEKLQGIKPLRHVDGLKNSSDKVGNKPICIVADFPMYTRNEEIDNIRDVTRESRRHPRHDTRKSATSQTNQRGRHGSVSDLPWTSRKSQHYGIWVLAAEIVHLLKCCGVCIFCCKCIFNLLLLLWSGLHRGGQQWVPPGSCPPNYPPHYGSQVMSEQYRLGSAMPPYGPSMGPCISPHSRADHCGIPVQVCTTGACSNTSAVRIFEISNGLE